MRNKLKLLCFRRVGDESPRAQYFSSRIVVGFNFSVCSACFIKYKYLPVINLQHRSKVKGLLFIILLSSRVNKLHFKHQTLMLILNVGKLKVNMSPAPEDGNTQDHFWKPDVFFFFFAFFEVIFWLVDKAVSTTLHFTDAGEEWDGWCWSTADVFWVMKSLSFGELKKKKTTILGLLVFLKGRDSCKEWVSSTSFEILACNNAGHFQKFRVKQVCKFPKALKSLYFSLAN